MKLILHVQKMSPINFCTNLEVDRLNILTELAGGYLRVNTQPTLSDRIPKEYNQSLNFLAWKDGEERIIETLATPG